MPWDKKTVDGKICVYKKTTGEVMHCYSGDDADSRADKYLSALYANANEKDLQEWLSSINKEAATSILKQSDGSYRIVCVATAEVKDREGETYEVMAMDYDIELAKHTGDYPLFTMFHKHYLDVGKVTKMRRVGKFAVDEGVSHTDAFSLSVCKNILETNDGRWGVSRGFYALETSGYCPNCSEGLVLTTKHMLVGFVCPSCNTTYINYKGVLKDLHFRKTKTFEDTITDIPCVPFTGVSAFKADKFAGLEDFMNKQELKERLVKAGIDEATVDERLAQVTEKQLGQYDDIPMAKLLKELDIEAEEVEKEEPEADDEDIVTFEQLRKAWKEDIQEAFDGLEIEISEPEQKEIPQVVELKAQVAELTKVIKQLSDQMALLTKKDDARLKEMLADTPRNAKFRIARFKAMEEAEDEEEEEDEDEEKPPMKKKQLPKGFEEGVVYGSDGQVYNSLTDAVLGN